MTTQQKGFTLIELLITMAIFSVISVISYQALSTSFKNETIQSKHSDALFQLQRTLNYLERDITQTSNQNIVLNNAGISFNSIQNEQLLNIKYRFRSDQLIRIDNTNQEQQPSLSLINNLSRYSFKALDNKGRWQTHWNKKKDQYLKAVEIKFSHPYWGNITKLVMLNE